MSQHPDQTLRWTTAPRRAEGRAPSGGLLELLARTAPNRAAPPRADLTTTAAPVSGPAPSTACETIGLSPTVLPVSGTAGSVGATTLSLALATAAGGPARVIECCGQTRTGLAAAAHAELGATTDWLRGYRGDVMLERAGRPLHRVDDVPRPVPGQAQPLTLLDVGWPLPQVLAATGWVSPATVAATAVIVVTPASMPGARQVSSAAQQLRSLGWNGLLVVAVRGPRRLPRPLTQALARDGTTDDLVTIPHDRELALRGITHRDLPAALLRTAEHLLSITNTHIEGNPR